MDEEARGYRRGEHNRRASHQFRVEPAPKMRARIASCNRAKANDESRFPLNGAGDGEAEDRDRVGGGDHQRTWRIERLDIGALEKTPSRHHHQSDGTAEIAAIDAEQELECEDRRCAQRQPGSQQDTDARPERQRQRRQQEQPPQRAIEQRARRRQQEYAAHKATQQCGDKCGHQLHAADRAEAVAIDPGTSRAARIERRAACSVRRNRRNASRDKRRQRDERATACERVHGSGDKACQ